MNRRVFISSLALTAGGCQLLQNTTQLTADAQQLVDDAKTIAVGLGSATAAIASAAGLAGTAGAKVQGWIQGLRDTAAKIETAAAAGVKAAAPYVSGMASLVAGLDGDLKTAGVPLPASVSLAITAAKALLPVLLSVAGLALSGPPATMPAEQARLILKAAAARAD